MNELFKLVGRIVIENDEANNEIDNTTNKAEKGSGKIVGAFKKIGAAVVTYMAVDKIIGFGKACVEAAAEVQAQNAQFEASFKDLQGEATKAFKRVGDDTGILASRLQVEGTKAFSMFKGAGMDANNALKESERFLKLTADAAAYYDISLEEASERVLGFAKGNFENGDAIGVFTNETQRNTIALDKYGKKFSELTEAQKQMLSLDMIENTYELSGAIGQASREADGYENVMGNLKESWRQFIAVIGVPILKATIPVVKGITEGITSLTEKVKTFGSTFNGDMTFMKSIWDTYGKPIFDSLMSVVNTIKTQWEVVFPYIKGLFITLWDAVKVAWDSIGKPVFDFVVVAVRKVSDIFNAIFPSIAQVVGEVFNTLAKLTRQVLIPAFEIIGNYLRTYLLPVFESVFDTIAVVVKNAWNVIKTLWDTFLKPVLQGIINFVGGVLQGDWAQAWDGLKSIVTNVFNGIKSTIQSILNAISDVISSVIGTIKNIFNTGFKYVWDTAKKYFNNVYESIKGPMNKASNFVKGIIDTIKGFFNFKITWPKIPLPHFSVKPKDWSIGDLLKGEIPSLGIDWYAKGGILEKPTVFGISPNGRAMVGGEAGKEAVAPISELMDYVRIAVAESNGSMADILNRILYLLADYLPVLANLKLVLDTGTLVGELAEPIDERLGIIKNRKERQ